MEQVYFACAIAGSTVLVVQSLMSFLGAGGYHSMESHDFGGGDTDLHVGEVHGGDLHGGGHDPVGETELQDTEGGGASAHHAEISSQAWFVGLFTFRTVLAALTVFGFTGMATATGGFSPANSFVLAFAAGAGALWCVAWMMRVLYSLKHDGTVQIFNAVGEVGTVYLTVPARKAGSGKVTVIVQNRTMEYLAVTEGEALPTGATVQVQAVIDADTVQVVPALCVQEAVTV